MNSLKALQQQRGNEALNDGGGGRQRRMGANVFGGATSDLCHNKFCVPINLISDLFCL